MPTSKDNALKFVKAHCGKTTVARYRNYAATNFLAYGRNIGAIAAEVQKSWALYKKFDQKKDGGQGCAYLKAVEFYYTEGVDGPTIINVTKATPGAKLAKLEGFGQCNFFADQAYQMLKVPAAASMAGNAPLIEKISTKHHNWVFANRDHADQANWVVVDLWLLALGIPYEKSICALDDAGNTQFYLQAVDVEETWDPNA